MIARLRTIGLVAALFALLLAVPSAARAADDPKLEARRDQIKAGETLRFTGSGFTPNKVVSVWASKGNDNYKDQNKPRADDDGEISFEFSIPNDTEIGDWVMNAEDTANDKAGKPIATARFKVTEATDAFAISPASGPPGTKFSFVVGGFGGDKKVALEFTGPDAQIYKYDTGGRLSNNDRILLEVGKAECEGTDASSRKVAFCWQSPPGAQPGRWLIRLIGTKTSQTRVIGLNITAP
jgi:hypothetical protein